MAINTESAAQLFSRLGAKQSLDGLDKNFFKGLQKELEPGDSVELYGEEGSGKTEMLIHFCVNCILPKAWKSISLSGKEAKVVYVDTAYKFPLWRLVEVLEKRIRNEVGESCFISTAEVDEIVSSCLNRLFLIRCTSSLNLLKSLSYLEQFLHENTDICILMIDTISEFYWTDRTIGGTTKYQQEAFQRSIISKLKKFQERFHLLVIVTKSAIMNQNFRKLSSTSVAAAKDNSRGFWSPDDYLSPEWNKFLTYKFHLKGKLVERASKNQNLFVASLLNQTNFPECKFMISDSGVKFL